MSENSLDVTETKEEMHLINQKLNTTYFLDKYGICNIINL